MTNFKGNEKPEYKEWRSREQNYLDYLDDVTSYPLVEQEKILGHILRKNAGTEYLQKYKLNGATDVETFREHLPVSDYDAYKPYIERIYEGDASPLLCADPVVEILTSSGTSGGEPKMYPITQEDMELRGLVWSFMRPVLNRAMPGLEKGKCLFFYFMREAKVTPGGLPCHPAVSSFIKSSAFQARPFDPSYLLTSPDEVTSATNNDEAMYCHLLLGLLQREEVLRFGAIFSAVIIKAVRCLEESWPAICDDIANGTLSSSVKDETVRKAVLPMLRKDPALAEFVRGEFSNGKALDGVIRRLWPNVRAIDTVCTGSMEAYIPAINNYTGNVPVICTQLYAATEGYFGINLNPMCTPDKIYYTLAPFVAYYEFIAVADGKQKLDPSVDEILDLLSVKEGQEYEILVTTVAGLYRFRMGDILKVVGFYNSTPIFQFMRRMNIVLSIDTDKTDERELHTAVTRGTKVLERELGLRFVDYTSTPDFSSKKGHYVIFWELAPSSTSVQENTFQTVLEQCCTEMESSFNFIYRRGRHENVIGPLELRLVREGTFDLLAKEAFARGATLAQYKTPRGISATRSALLETLNSQVLHKAFAPGTPPFTPGVFRSSLSGRHMIRESTSGRRVILESRSGHLKA